MNVYALLSLSSSVVCVILGAVVYSINRKALLNKVFILTCLAGFFYVFTEVMMWQASGYESAYLWNKMGSIWPFFAVLVVHFALAFTKSGWLKNKFTYLLLYLPAVLFWVVDLSTDLINGPPVLEYWGWEDTSSVSLVYGLSTIWTAVMPVLAFVLCFRYYRAAVEESQRQQRRFVTIGFAIPIVTYLITNLGFPSVGIIFPNLGHIAILFFSGFVGYAILKYELFTFDAAIAAENIVSTMPDSLILADMKGKMLKVNGRLLDFLGYEEDELIGSSISKLCVEDKRCMNVLNELTEKRLVRNCELAFKTKSSDKKTVLFSGSVVRSKTGRDIGITCVIHDITDRKEMEERLVKAERFASIGELAGQIGHDLRNPLTGIKSGAYFLSKKGERLSEADRKKILDSMDDAVEDSNRIINGLLEYSSDLHLEVSTCTPKSLLSNVLRKLQIPERIKVFDRLLEEPVFSVDVNKMESVFTKIIMNAVEAMPKNGTLELRSIQKGSNVEITFIDSGVGIPENIRSRIFSPLVTTKAKGMGLGLAICKRIVDAHEGKIAVESTEGKGTTLTVTLPIKPKFEFAVENNWLATGASGKSHPQVNKTAS